MSNNDNNYLSTSISTKNLARVIEDDGTDNFNDMEGLKDLLIELSKEYDECKEKYDLLVQSNYEKEKIIQEFIESSTLKEEGYNKHKSELYGEIEKLNDKIREYEMNLFSENLKDVEKKNRRLNKQKSLHYRKFINTDKIFKMENPIIENKSEFKKRHQTAINVIQSFEPFFIAKFGSADPFSNTSSKRFPKGSQRIASSRYVSAGTYDSKKMISGKLLNEDRLTLEKNWPSYFWYNKLYKQINYNKNEKVGFDINYNKFKNHGIELRFFDWFPEKDLEEVLTFLVYL